MSLNKIRGTLLVTSMVLIMIVLGLTSAINMVTFYNSYKESLAASYQVFAEQKVRNIEYAVRYGKTISNFYGIEGLLSENLPKVDGIKEVQVVLPSGDILYNQDGSVIDKQVVAQAKEKMRFFDSQTNNHFVYFVDNQNYYIYSPIYDQNKKWIASLGLVFDDTVVTSVLNQYRNQIIINWIGFSILTLLLLLLFLYKFPIISESKAFLKKRITIILLVILGGTQIVFGCINYYSLKNGYLELEMKNTSFALNVIQSDIEKVIHKGVPYSGLNGVGNYMNEMIHFLPEVSRISIINVDFTTDYTDGQVLISKYSYSDPLPKDSTTGSKYINVVDLSDTFINNKMQGILLDTITIIIVSLFLIVEMTVFILLYLERRLNRDLVVKEFIDNHEERMFIRPLSFIVFCAAFISAAYIPLMMKELYQPLLGLPKEVVLGLPLTLEIIFVLMAFLLAGPLNDQKGWRSTFIIGLSILIVGTLLSALSWNQLLFLASRMIAGMGLGVAVLAMYRYSFLTGSNNLNRDTFAQFQLGSISGMYLGISIGALLAERIGLFHVYFIAIPLFLLAILVVLKFIPNVVVKRVVRRRKHYRTKRIVGAFLFDNNVMSLLLFMVIPVSAASMFLYYFIPIFADSREITIANIGRVFLFQGLLIIYLGPVYAKYVNRYISLRSSMVISASLLAISFLLFSVQNSFIFVIITITLLGLANCIGYETQLEYFKKQNTFIELEEGKIVAYFTWFKYIGKVIGLLFFVFVYMIFGSSLGIGILGGFLLFSTLLFAFLTNKEGKKDINQSMGDHIQ